MSEEFVENVESEDDFGESVETEGSLEIGGTTSGTIEGTGDRDWFQVTLQAGVMYQFDLRSVGSREDELQDPFIHGIFDGEGNLIEGTMNDNFSLYFWDSRVFFTPSGTGTYYISAGARAEGTGTYEIGVRAIVRDDHGDTSATAGTVAVGESTTGTVDSGGERDWFAVTLEAGQTYRISITGNVEGNGTLAVPMLHGLFDGNGTLFEGTTRAGGQDGGAVLEFKPTETASYYISAGGFGNLTGTYQVDVIPIGREAATELGDLTNPGKAKFLKQSIDGTLNDTLYYKFTVTERSEIEFGLRRQDRDADLFIEDEDGNVLFSGTRDGRLNEAVRTQLEAGTYYVRVEAQEGGVNDYILRYGPPTRHTAKPDTDATPENARNMQFFDNVATAAGKVDGISDAVDYLKFTLTEAKVVAIRLHGYGDPESGLRRDINMTLRDAEGNVIQISANSGRKGESMEELLEAGTYYVQLAAHEGGTSPYEVDIVQKDLPGVLIDDTAGHEGSDATLRFKISLTEASSVPVKVSWGTSERTAKAGEDYQISSGVVTFAPGETEKWVEVPIINDTVEDSGETLIVRIKHAQGAVIEDGEGEGTIFNTESETRMWRNHELSARDRDFSDDVNTEGQVTADGTPVRGMIQTRFDEDWFKLIAAAGEGQDPDTLLAANTTYYIEVKGLSTRHGGLADPFIQIYDENGRTAVGYDSNGGSGYNARKAFTTGNEQKVYYVGVQNDLERVMGDYELTVSTERDDIGQNTSTAKEIKVNGSSHEGPGNSGEIQFTGDVDWFKVELSNHTTYEITASGTLRPVGRDMPQFPPGPGSFSEGYRYYTDPRDRAGTLSDPEILGIYDNNGNLLAGTSDKDSGGGMREARIVFTATRTGDYYIAVASERSEVGTYSVTVEQTGRGDDATANTETDGEITVNAAMKKGYHERRGDVDWFEVTLEEDTEYRFTALGKRQDPDLTHNHPTIVGLYDADGELISGTDASNREGNEWGDRLFFTPREAGTYYLAVGPHPEGGGVRQGTYGVEVIDHDADDHTAYVSDEEVTVGGLVYKEVEGDAAEVTVAQVSGGNKVSGEVEFLDDRDLFKVTLSEAGWYYLRLGVPEHAGSANAVVKNIYVAHMEQVGGKTVVREVEDYRTIAGAIPAKDTYLNGDAKTYYIEVGTYGTEVQWELNSIGGYTVEVFTTEEPEDLGSASY